ncbi:hypothetical protein [Bradyrhizobium sp.]|uniref:hypothetical protein n=1 Tax=Bradyrhizobium sp. TaxID=376 RepID=UPI001ECA9EE2|nr:hypothetical protein [Bradyrhizobium sp.]MBV9984168.1 hypothetical protein [Bradyrhizobium sp.]
MSNGQASFWQTPQQQEGVLVPQGLIGNIIGALAPLVGRAVGGTAGNVIGAAGQQFGPMIPFSAGPQMTQAPQQQGQQQDAVLVPQGLIGSIIGALAPIVGQRVGGTAGNVISTAGQFASMIPFSAAPQMAQQWPQQGQQGMAQQGQQDAVLVPQGLIGSIIGALAPIVGQRVGGTAGNVISTAGQFANMIPFSAAPQMAQQWPQQGQQGMAQQWPQQGQQGMAQQGQQDAVLVPQGLIGSIIGALAPIVGHRVGGTAGNVISTAGQFAHLLPFAAGPQLQQQGQQGMPQQGQQDGVLVPQGLIGNIIGALAPLVGHAVGGTAGHLIGAAGQQFGPMIPFSAAPQMGQQWPTSQQGQWPWQPPPASFPWATAGTA